VLTPRLPARITRKHQQPAAAQPGCSAAQGIRNAPLAPLSRPAGSPHGRRLPGPFRLAGASTDSDAVSGHPWAAAGVAPVAVWGAAAMAGTDTRPCRLDATVGGTAARRYAVPLLPSG